MDRHTERDGWLIRAKKSYEHLVSKLAEYEDTGLDPKQIMDMLGAKYDSTTQEWFQNNPATLTALAKCDVCGLFYKPSLWHKCETE